MGLKYEELSLFAQFFPQEEIAWREYKDLFTHDASLVYVYGFSPCIEPLLEWVEKEEKREIVFIEDRVAILGKIREERCQEILNHEQVHFRFYFENQEWDDFLFELVCTFPKDKIAIISLHEEEERFHKVKQVLFQKSSLQETLYVELLNYQRIAANVLRNFPRLLEAFDVTPWKDQFKGVPALICGAGPSLDTLIDDIKSVEEKAIIFAGGSTIPILTAKGVMPHLIAAIDPNPEEFTRLAFHTAYDVPLLFGGRVEHNIFYSHRGPLGYFSFGAGGPLEEWLEKEVGIEQNKLFEELGEGGCTVTSIIFMLALYFGCNPIILAGVDLSYDRGRKYTGDVICEPQASLEEDAKTLSRWAMERDALDKVASFHKETTFLKASSKGLPFEHIYFDPDWKNKLGDHKDLRTAIFNQVMQTKLQVDAKKIKEALLLFQESMKRCKEIVTKIKEGSNIDLLELDLEEEIAFQHALKPTFSVYRFQIKDEAPDSLKKLLYSKLDAVIDQYLQLW